MRKLKGSPMFSGGRERVHWERMGKPSCRCISHELNDSATMIEQPEERYFAFVTTFSRWPFFVTHLLDYKSV